MSREQFLLTIVGIPVAALIVAFTAWTVVTMVREYLWRTRDDHRLEGARRAQAAALKAYDDAVGEA